MVMFRMRPKMFFMFMVLSILTYSISKPELIGMWVLCDESGNCTLDSTGALYHFSDSTLIISMKLPDGLDPVDYSMRYELKNDTLITYQFKTFSYGIRLRGDSMLVLSMGNDSALLKRL